MSATSELYRNIFADKFNALPNKIDLGEMPKGGYMPHSSAACHGCLIPYRVNDETRAINSPRLHEYLAAGKPVVCARACRWQMSMATLYLSLIEQTRRG